MSGRKKRVAPLLPRVRCKAHSKRTGEPCNNPPMNGQKVCRMHGGASAASRARAKERILAASDPAAAKIVQLMQDKRVPPLVQLAAARDLLDRAGLAKGVEVTVELRKFEENIEGLLIDVVDAEVVDAEVVDAELVDEGEGDPLLQIDRSEVVQHRERRSRSSSISPTPAPRRRVR